MARRLPMVLPATYLPIATRQHASCFDPDGDSDDLPPVVKGFFVAWTTTLPSGVTSWPDGTN